MSAALALVEPETADPGVVVDLAEYRERRRLTALRSASGSSPPEQRIASEPGLYRYTAFGGSVSDPTTPAAPTGVNALPVRWKGRWLMYSTGAGASLVELYDMRARWWWPQGGVYLSIDRFRYGSLRATLWAWPGQNPFKWSDPSGHNPVAIALAEALATAGAAVEEAAVAVEEGAEAAAVAVEGAVDQEILNAASFESRLESADALAQAQAEANAGGSCPNASFLGQQSGPAIPVPQGATGPSPTRSPGFQFNGGEGGNGLADNVTDVRVMDGNGGYVNYGSQQANGGWQSVNPYTGDPVSKADPWWHIQLK